MKQLRARNGSALLIVLGMVAFMIVSAVGFAVFMRHNRIPSSFLRRSTSSHQMARAALSVAMDGIEKNIGDNPYPGIGDSGDGGRNRWRGRVLVPSGEVDESTTASTLSLEGLAYLPPAVVNDVRYWSRRTSTARWLRLDYDSGRCAYCVVNVSDFFDLSRLRADVPRGSGDLGLITLTSLFEDADHKNWLSGTKPVEFQRAMDAIESEMPIVSLADYNLAIAKQGSQSGLESPFVKYVESNGANGFYGWTRPPSRTGDEFLKFAIQRFVVDGHSELSREEWFESRGEDDVNPFRLADIDISKPENQPFPELLKGDSETENDYSAGHICDMDTAFLNARLRQINPCEAIALYDYLDRDNVPASVAVPTVERAPMIVGVEVDADSDLKVEIAEYSEEKPPITDATGERITTKEVTFYPKFTGRLDVNTGYTFPFKYRKELNAKAGDFKAEAVAYMYAISDDETWASKNTSRGCRTAIGGVMKEWPESGKERVELNKDGLLAAVSRERSIKIPADAIADETDAVSKSGGTFHDAQLSISNFENTEEKFKSDGFIAKFYLRKRERMQDGSWQVVSEGVDGWEIDPDKNSGKPETKLKVLKFRDGQMNSVESGKTYVWGMSLAIRLYDKNDNLVDMAPAHVNDDNEQPSGDFRGWLGGLGRPVLRFDGKAADHASFAIKDGIEGYKELSDKAAESKGGQALGLLPKTYLTDDPRYNYAAENWYEVATGNSSLGEAWLDQTSCGKGDNARLKDNDIFMSVSNQGYLQDPGELAFLPRVCGFNPGGMTEMKPITENATGAIPDGRDNVANKNQMWRTYGCFGDLGDDEVDNLRLTSPVKGFRMTPYTRDEITRFAPFLNTPYDWWAAGTNQSDVVKKRMIDMNGRTTTPEEAIKYSFSERGTEAKIEYDNMKTLALAISNRISSDDGDLWYEKWKDLAWGLENSETSICGVDVGRTLHDVDRKFLCSYWRKCYANAQQLFVVFFRAEPVVIGGSPGDGNVPAQLGARGMAVVWREPTLPVGAPGDAPHRMRVLFYRQLD